MPSDVVRSIVVAALAVGALGCDGAPEPDAHGSFEAEEVVVSAQTTGQVREFVPREGMRLERGAVVALIDTVPLALERDQLTAQRAAVLARDAEIAEQARALAAQREIAGRALGRTRRLHAARAATAQQLDQAERDDRVLEAQQAAARAQRRSVGLEAAAAAARVAQLEERIARSRVVNPTAGTVLAVHARAGEVVQAGQPLYRVASLDTLELRAYVTGAQLASVRLGLPVHVHVDAGPDSLRAVHGTVAWIASSAEFTPTPVQTRDERATLVYAVRIRVPNPDGALRIGMPADVTFGAPPAGPASAGR